MASGEAPLVSVIIVNWNGKEDLIQCLESLKRSRYKNIEIIIFDNGSTDGSTEVIENLYTYIKLIKNKTNIGFTGGNNIGVKAANGKYIYLLNNDVTVTEDTIIKLVETMESDPKIGCCGSKVYLKHNNLLNSAGHCVNQLGFLWARGFMEKDTSKYDKREDIFMCSACSIMIRKDFIQRYKLFDEDLFMYGEELELALKVWGAGYKIVYEPKSLAFHGHSKSTSKIFSPRPSSFQIFYSNRNRAKVVIKYYPSRIILKNIHLFLFSLIYWDLHILKYDGYKKLFEAIISQIVYAKNGFIERKDVAFYDSTNWVKFIRNHSFYDFLTFAMGNNDPYSGLNKRL